jgi:tetratricopeptide (TPR) repeat protein
MKLVGLALITALVWAASVDLEEARNRQSIEGAEKIARERSVAASEKIQEAPAQYDTALAYSYAAEVAQELRDKKQARRLAEAGIPFAERAVKLEPRNGEYHRILGTLCGQIVPADLLAGLSYGKRAQDELALAVQLEPKSHLVYLSRGVGYYYLPSAFGGGIDKAMNDFKTALDLNPRSSDAWLWMGIALRRQNRNAEARKALEKALTYNPGRRWAKDQLDRTPAN